MVEFSFIHDNKLRLLLERDCQELEICVKNKAHKSVLILSGSIIEAMLVDYFLQNMPENLSENKVLRKDLFELIDLAFNASLISDMTKNLSSVIRNYRNLIHPGREVRSGEKCNEETAIVAYNLLKMITGEIKENYLKKNAYSALDVLSKLEEDSSSIVIFNALIENLNMPQKVILMEHLINYPEDRISSLKNPKDYIDLLKPLIPVDEIKKKALDLLRQVHFGSRENSIRLYYYFNKDLHLLKQEEREVILIYIFSVLKGYMESIEDLDRFSRMQIFNSFGGNLVSQRIINGFQDFVQCLVLLYSTQEYEYEVYFEVFSQIKYSLTEDQQEDFNKFLDEKKYLFSGFLKAYEMSGHDLPF